MLLADEPSATLEALAACGAGLAILRRRRDTVRPVLLP
jgi:hypothetical protein